MNFIHNFRRQFAEKTGYQGSASDFITTAIILFTLILAVLIIVSKAIVADDYVFNNLFKICLAAWAVNAISGIISHFFTNSFLNSEGFLAKIYATIKIVALGLWIILEVLLIFSFRNLYFVFGFVITMAIYIPLQLHFEVNPVTSKTKSLLISIFFHGIRFLPCLLVLIYR